MPSRDGSRRAKLGGSPRAHDGSPRSRPPGHACARWTSAHECNAFSTRPVVAVQGASATVVGGAVATGTGGRVLRSDGSEAVENRTKKPNGPGAALPRGRAVGYAVPRRFQFDGGSRRRDNSFRRAMQIRAMDKEAVRALLAEIVAMLESTSPVPLVPLLRKASRLATAVGAVQHRTLFELHLDGVEEKESGTARVSPIATADLELVWRMVKADRWVDGTDQFVVKPLQEMAAIYSRLVAAASGGELPADELNKTHDLIHALEVTKTRITNRVGVFVNIVMDRLANGSETDVRSPLPMGSKVFIGHGAAPAWKDLCSFLGDRLRLQCVEFNTESQAGNTTCARLREILDDAGFAFLVMTGEDSHSDGTVHARENVIHEAGLFQGRLGFNRAIVLLEDGCARFSNIHGLTYIGFPKGSVLSASEEIRRVLEREGLLSAVPG
jgi:predicted nucleotide-binding protein